MSIRLNTGELEVLVTSLLDEKEYPTEDFKEIYNYQRGIEGFYGVIKERFSLPNFSGKTVLSVKQDFYSTMFLTGLESLTTQVADLRLAIKSECNVLKQTVNNMVSLSVLKNHVNEMFYCDIPIIDVLEALTNWFMMDPTIKDRERQVL